ncbi:MAG: YggS family pyridoxal phosphate enzyme [Thermoleophilia bacterium]
MPPADVVRERIEAIRAKAGPGVTVVVATKYVPLEAMGLLTEAGIVVVGENRAQDLLAKHERWGDAFRWHFIGQLQSNKAAAVSRAVELVHSLDSLSAARRLTVPALIQVNLAGEASKAGIPPDELPRFVEDARAAGVDVRGLTTMPPLAGAPEESRPYFRRLAELARELGLPDLSMGTTQDWPVAVEEGATLVRVGSALFRR